MTTQQADAVIIGAGVIGASVAYELARSGRSVISVDKGPAPGAGSTSSSASIIRFSYSTLDAVLTAWESAAVWEAWAEHLGADDPDGMARFVRTGNLIFCTEGYDGSGDHGAVGRHRDPVRTTRRRRDPRALPQARPRAFLATEAHRRPGLRRRSDR